MPDIGKEAINKTAEIGIKSQLDEVEEVDVEIETDPLKLVSGQVDHVSIKGEGMVMQKDLRIEEMNLETGSVAINPLSVAFGKVELTHPTDAETLVTLLEADINRAFNSDFVRAKMQNLDVHVDQELATVDTQSLKFGLPGEGKVALSTDVILQNSNERKQVSFTAIPKIIDAGQQVVLEDVQYADGQELSPELTQALLQQATELLDLRNFELEGMSLKLKKLDVQRGKVVLQSEAHVEQFPSS
ncbi:DUF2993 domain-containing protein [Myxacorys almedinensis]|uniref:LmeA family phospholipid-binding protein n=1 Tax=Myxacorys almedinensis A TaxID=2690445 RepID=A0A8J7ZCI5_9CYAN|nr:DUF2993 domain-containing protein [Myxacorys almedinensis]NDJ19440.1 LmeA family phospholipid-binding protein [Myxacorys almedinensis A]